MTINIPANFKLTEGQIYRLKSLVPKKLQKALDILASIPNATSSFFTHKEPGWVCQISHDKPEAQGENEVAVSRQSMIVNELWKREKNNDSEKQKLRILSGLMNSSTSHGELNSTFTTADGIHAYETRFVIKQDSPFEGKIFTREDGSKETVAGAVLSSHVTDDAYEEIGLARAMLGDGKAICYAGRPGSRQTFEQLAKMIAHHDKDKIKNGVLPIFLTSFLDPIRGEKRLLEQEKEALHEFLTNPFTIEVDGKKITCKIFFHNLQLNRMCDLHGSLSDEITGKTLCDETLSQTLLELRKQVNPKPNSEIEHLFNLLQGGILSAEEKVFCSL